MSSSSWQLIRKFSDTSPAAAGVAASAATATGLSRYRKILIEFETKGGTGGTTDITVQTKLEDDLWMDWARTAAVAATVTTKTVLNLDSSAVFATVGTTDDALTGPYTVVLSAGNSVGSHPGDEIRLVYTAGVSTSAGADQVVRVYGLRHQ